MSNKSHTPEASEVDYAEVLKTLENSTATLVFNKATKIISYQKAQVLERFNDKRFTFSKDEQPITVEQIKTDETLRQTLRNAVNADDPDYQRLFALILA